MSNPTIEAAIQAAVASAVSAQLPNIIEAIATQIPSGGGGGGEGGPTVEQLAHVFRQVKVETKAESVEALKQGPGAAAPAAPAAPDTQDAGGEPDKPVKIADVMQAWSNYINLDTTAETQRILIASVSPVVEHFGVSRMREIDVDQFADSLRYCADLTAAFTAGGVEAVQAHKHDFQGDPEPADAGVL